jgi:hypothetical protein
VAFAAIAAIAAIADIAAIAAIAAFVTRVHHALVDFHLFYWQSKY